MLISFLLSIILALISSNICACDLGERYVVALKHRDPKGVGYCHGFSTIGIFFVPESQAPYQIFMEARGHLMNNARFASNVGVGMRGASRAQHWVFGGNLYWDFRDAKKLAPHQIGFGFEAVHDWVEFRLNSYVPLGNKRHIGKKRARGALPSLYVELGSPVPGIFRRIDLYIAIGPYYLFKRNLRHQKAGHVFGGRVRVSAKVTDGVTLGFDYTYDGIFRGRPQGNFSIQVPLGPGTIRRYGSRWRRRYNLTPSCSRKAILRRKLMQPVMRNEIIPIQEINAR